MTGGEDSGAGEELGAVAAAELAAEMAVAAAAPAAGAAQRDRTPPAAAGARGSPGNRGRGRGRGPRRLGGPGMGILLRVSASCRKAVLRFQLHGVRVVGVSKERLEGTEVGARAYSRQRGDAGVESGWRDRFRWLVAAPRDLLAQNL